MAHHTYDYYDVELPEDLTDEMTQDEILDLAILQAREMSHIYAVPCAWYMVDAEMPYQMYRIGRKRNKSKRAHYHVLVGMGGGYMPFSNFPCKTKGDAQHIARWEAQEWRDDYANNENGKMVPVYRVTGNKRDGYTMARRENTEYDLGHYIEITTCFESDCIQDLEN